MYTKIHIDYQVVTKSIYTKYTKNTPKTAKKMILTLIKEIKTAYEILEIVPSDRRKSVSGCMQEKVLQDIQCKPLYLCIREEDEGTALFGCLDWSYYRMAGDKVIGNDLFLRILKLQYAPPL